MNIPSKLKEMIADGESRTMEWKSHLEPLGEIAKAVCAMLNTDGGRVVIGVTDSGEITDHVTSGDVPKLESFLSRAITPSVLHSVTLEEVEGGHVIVVGVAKGRQRPFLADGKIFVRRGVGNVQATPNAIREMILSDASQSIHWERQVASGVHPADLDLELIQQTATNVVKLRSFPLSEDASLGEILEKLKLVQFGEVTNAGDVLFGSDVGLRLPQTRVRAVHYETDRAGDRFIDDQLLEGPLIEVFHSAMKFLKRNVAIQSRFIEGKVQRESKLLYPFEALREGVVNALVHRDYSAYSGSVAISVYPTRIDIYNSGSLPDGLTVGQLRQPGHPSIMINPDIGHVFYLNDLMERVGRGTNKIIRECREMGLPDPKWSAEANGIRLTFFSEAMHGFDLNERQLAIVTNCLPGDSVTVAEYHKTFDTDGSDVSLRQARRDIVELVDSGFFERIGAGRSTSYRRTAKELK